MIFKKIFKDDKLGLFLIFFFIPFCSRAQSQKYDSTEVAIVQDNAVNLYEKGHYKEALTLCDSLLTIVGQTRNTQWATLTRLKGNLLIYLNEFEKGEERLIAAKNYWILKKDTLNEYMANIYNNLGELHYFKSNLSESIAMFLKSKEVSEFVVGTENSDHAVSLNNIAILYYTMGAYEKAEQYYIECLEIKKRVLGENDASYAQSLNNLGALYMAMNAFEKAESVFLKAKEVRVDVLGKENSKYGQTLNNLAFMYKTMGLYEKAEQLYLESKQISENVFGKNHSEYSTRANNLGNLYKFMGLYDKAEILLNEAATIRKNILGEEHALYATSLSNIGSLHNRTGAYNKAVDIFSKVVQIREKVLGEDHPDYAEGLSSLANAYQNLGAYEKAEILFLQAIEKKEKLLGKKHPSYALNLGDLASVYFQTGRRENAEELLTQYHVIQQEQIEKAFNFLSEKEKERFIRRKVEPYYSFVYSFGIKNYSPDLIYDLALISKGLQLSASRETIRFILGNESPVIAEDYERLLGIHRLLSKKYSLPISKRKGIETLEQEKETLEKGLAKASSQYRNEQIRIKVKNSEVKAALNLEGAAIEFVKFNYRFSNHVDSILYAAAILKPNEAEANFLVLFEEKKLESILNTNNQKEDLYTDLYVARGLTPKNKRKLSKNLYKLIWEPIEPYLNDVKTVHYSTAGLLHQLNLSALPISGTETLGDKYQLNQLISTRQIALRNLEEKYSKKDALILGGIEYDSKIEVEKSDSLSEVFASAEFGFQNLNRGEINRGENWKYLPGTAKEAAEIHKTLKKAGYQSTLLSAKAATEEAVKSIGQKTESPRILHLATHGYFFPNPEKKSKTSNKIEPVFKLSDHPMIRSGLILAGGNRAWQGEAQIPGKEDGILTAYEISQMNLTNTELVVLSACETGLGDIKGNEGVFGLQRAFKMAGAKYLIMSLWQVPDKQTQELMTIFYKNYFKKKMTIPEAFRAAQQKMRKKYSDPNSWAGFVLVE